MIFENGKVREQHTPYHGNIFIGGGGADGSAPFSGSGGNGVSIPITFGGQDVREFVSPFIRCGVMRSDLDYAVARRFTVNRVIFSAPATIVYWSDGTKTVVKCDSDDTYSKETGVALCFMKKALGNKGNYNQVLKRLIEQD